LSRHPHDEGVWLGGVDALQKLPDGVDAVVSLCRLGDTQVPAPGVAPGDHVEVWLIDDPDPAKNSNLDFVLTDAVAAVAALRAEGKAVLLHCVQARSRTPAVAALYGARLTGRTPTQCLVEIEKVLPRANPNAALHVSAGAAAMIAQPFVRCASTAAPTRSAATASNCATARTP
jgi:ADP-ribosyl-[dinitrogen reductase] hydrolase